jgi:hypothetical protein
MWLYTINLVVEEGKMDVKKMQSLSKVESYVLNILESGTAKTDEVNKIANLCNLTEIQVMVALQLLTHKKVFPTIDILHEIPNELA